LLDLKSGSGPNKSDCANLKATGLEYEPLLCRGGIEESRVAVEVRAGDKDPRRPFHGLSGDDG